MFQRKLRQVWIDAFDLILWGDRVCSEKHTSYVVYGIEMYYF